MSDIEYNAKNRSMSKRLYEDADGKVVDLTVHHDKEEIVVISKVGGIFRLFFEDWITEFFQYPFSS